MKVADADVTLVSPDTAYSTCIRIPRAEIQGALLAVKLDPTGDKWLLAKRQTIPWADRSAAGTLTTSRGMCQSVRTPEREPSEG
jgi:hypothetical protein